MKLFQVWFNFSVQNIEIQEIGKMKNGDYAVAYKAKLFIDYEADDRTRRVMNEGSFNFLRGLIDIANAKAPQPRIGTFRLTPEGWRSPTEATMMAEGVDKAMMMTSSLVNQIHSEIFGMDTVRVYP
jgi:hypothetical protein